MGANVKILAVDGFDGVGKSWFTSQLTTYLKKNISPKQASVIRYHFPYEESDSWQQVKKIFAENEKISKKTARAVFELCMRNRMDWWVDNYEDLCYPGKDTVTIVVADRYTMSNFLYNFPHMYKDGTCYLEMMEKYKEEEAERFKVHLPDIQYFLACDRDLQFERLRRRAVDDTDRYETEQNLEFLLNRAPEIIAKYSNVFGPVEILPSHLFDKRYMKKCDIGDIRAAERVVRYYNGKILTKVRYKLLSKKNPEYYNMPAINKPCLTGALRKLLNNDVETTNLKRIMGGSKL